MGTRLSSLASDVRDLLSPLLGPSTIELAPARWLVIARVEDDRSDFPEARRISHRMLSEFVDTFDPEVRRVPVICSQGEGVPAHWADPLPPVGRVTALERDHLNLWGEVRSFVDPVLGLPRIDVCVADGFTQQSIGFRTTSAETGGRARIWHLAQLSEGEPPGIANMPRLDEMGFGLDDEQLRQLQERRAGYTAGGRFGLAARQVLAEWRGFGGVETFREQAGELEYRCRAGLAACGDSNLLEEITTMKAEELRTLVEQTLTPAVEGLLAASRALVAVQTSASTAEPPNDSENPPESRGATEPVSQPPQPTTPPPDLSSRAFHIARRATALGVLEREQARVHAQAAVAGGESALEVFRRLVDDIAAQKRGQVFREVRTSQGAVTVNPSAPAWHSCTQEVRVDPGELAILTEEAAAIRQEHRGQVDPEILARRCSARLEREHLL